MDGCCVIGSGQWIYDDKFIIIINIAAIIELSIYGAQFPLMSKLWCMTSWGRKQGFR